MYLCQYCGEVFDEPTVEEEKDVGYHGLSCPKCGEEMEVIDQLLEGNSLMDVIGEDKKEEKEKC